MANLFDTVRSELQSEGINPRSDDSREWFLDKVGQIGRNVNRDTMLRKPPLKPVSRVLPGQMFMFYYDPKHSRTLPYYDSFPLVLLLDTVRGGMSGLNLHYLPMTLRQKLFYGLLNSVSSENLDEDTYVRMTYNFLKGARSLKEYRPCYKRYLTEHIRGDIVKVPAQEWETAVHLPTALFRKKQEQEVHRESERMIERF